jgi:hypothetical protein
MQLSHARLVPVPEGRGSSYSTWSWSLAGPDGWVESEGNGLVIPCIAGAQQGLKPAGLREGGWYPGELWDWLQSEVQRRWVVGILEVMDPLARPWGGYSGMVCVRRLEASTAEGQVSRHMWVWRSLGGGAPGRTEQWLCRPWGTDLAGRLFLY